MDSTTTKFFGEGASPGQFGNPKHETPKLQYGNFLQQLIAAARGANATEEWQHYLYCDATYHRIHGANARPDDVAPVPPNNNAGQGPWAAYKIEEAANRARRNDERQFIDVTLVNAMHPNILDIIAEEVNGVDIGTTRRRLPEVFDLLDAAFGTADFHAIRAVQARMTEPYNPAKENFLTFCARFKKDKAFLERNQSLPPDNQLFDMLKAAVATSMSKATDAFEDQHTMANWTLSNLTTYLSAYYDRKEATITAHHAINAAKAVTHAPTQGNSLEDINQQMATLMKGQTRTLSTEGVARVQRIVQRALQQAIQQELDPKICKNHPNSRNHTTADCRFKGGNKGKEAGGTEKKA